MKLQRLKSTLPTLKTDRFKVLETKAGATQRMGGDRWMKIRRDVLVAGHYACVDCGHVAADNEIDHQIPLEQGGSHDESNLRIRCKVCHAAKTAEENRARWGK